jgi:hypothetical protein
MLFDGEIEETVVCVSGEWLLFKKGMGGSESWYDAMAVYSGCDFVRTSRKKHNSPRKSSMPSNKGVPDSIQRRSHSSSSQFLAIDVVEERISCISSKTTRPQE